MSRVSLFVAVVLGVAPLEVASQLTGRWYEEACEGGSADACNVFGSMYLLGEGVTQDLARAAALFERACVGGVMVGCTNLGRMHEVGAGVPEDSARASNLYEAACEGGELLACDLVAAERTGGVASVDGLFNTGDVGHISGRVMDEGGARGLADVDIMVLGESSVRALSNRQGRFTLRNLPPGSAEIRFARLGYTPRVATLLVLPGRTVDVSATMSTQPIELEAIEVTVRSRNLEQNGFYRRAAEGLGSRFTRKDLESLDRTGRVSDVLVRVPGVSVRRNGPGRAYAESMRGLGLGTRCRLQVYVDGVRTSQDLDLIPPAQIEAMEVYNGISMPMQYLGDGCGIVLIWTRR